ncbi:flagellar motor protein MotB [Priestia megaterium]|uniref:flagellar motor protein MotB n=1 Tax=Priestia megaterium TaxID=1404 RepID=UPI002E1CCB51|nr:flagellar motor protein MotB [Priestia megaterium]
MKKKHEGHVNHERYLVTYSDLITLLLAFFIILYSMSTPDAKKMEALANQLSIQFSPQAESISPSLDTKNLSERKRGQEATEQEQKTMASVSEQNSLREAKEQIEKEVKERGLEKDVKTSLNDSGLKITLTDRVLFETGSAILNNKNTMGLLDEIGYVLSTIANSVSIEGHTDNVPINNPTYPSNWELSAARSLSVLREMVSFTPTLEPTRFSATGYGEFKPIADNGSDAGRQRNRRVEILVKRSSSDGLLKAERGDNKNE